MTAPEPVPPVPPRERLEARLRGYGLTLAQVTAALADADAYAAQMAEEIARPDHRWEPQ